MSSIVEDVFAKIPAEQRQQIINEERVNLVKTLMHNFVKEAERTQDFGSAFQFVEFLEKVHTDTCAVEALTGETDGKGNR